MAWIPISLTVPQYMDGNGAPYSGAVLKFYSAGTTTNISLATDSTGGTTASSVALNASGYPEVSGNVVIPHLEEDYKIALYPTQAAADADSGAVWTIDSISIGQDVAQWVDSGSTPTQASSTTFTVAGDQTSLFHVGRRLKLTDSGGTDYATVTAASYSSPNTTVTVAVDGGGALDAGLSTVQVSLLTADSTSAIPGVEVSADDWTFQGNVTIEGSATIPTISGGLAVSGALTAGTAPLPRSYLSGFALSNDAGDTAHDIAIAAGAARDSTDAVDLRLAATLTKQIDAAWSAGDDAGGFPTGLTLTTDTWYRVFLIGQTNGTIDAGFDISATAANLLSDATGYTLYRQIGWIRTYTGTGPDIRQFTQVGDEFYWKNPDQLTLDANGASVTTSESTITVSNAPASTSALLNVSIRRSSESAEARLYPTDVADAAVASSSSPLPTIGGFATGSSANPLAFSGQMHMRLDGSAQFHARASTTGVTLYALAVGWIDRRGRDD